MYSRYHQNAPDEHDRKNKGKAPEPQSRNTKPAKTAQPAQCVPDPLITAVVFASIAATVNYQQPK